MGKYYEKIRQSLEKARKWWKTHVPKRSRKQDEAKPAKTVLKPWKKKELDKWKKHHNKYDLLGIDDPYSNPTHIKRHAKKQREKFQKILSIHTPALFNKLFHRLVKHSTFFFRALKADEKIIEAVFLQLAKEKKHTSSGKIEKTIVSTSITPDISKHYGSDALLVVAKPLLKNGVKWWPLTYIPEVHLSKLLEKGYKPERGKFYFWKKKHEGEIRITPYIPQKAIRAAYIKPLYLDKVSRIILEYDLPLIPIPSTSTSKSRSKGKRRKRRKKRKR